MRNNFFAEKHPMFELFFFLFVVIVSFLFFSLVSVLIAIPAFGLTLDTVFNVMQNTDDPLSLSFLKYMQVFQSISLFVIPPLVMAWFYGGDFKEKIGFVKVGNINLFVLVALMMVSFIPFINFLAELNSKFPLPEKIIEREMLGMELTEKLVHASTIPQLLFNLFMIAVIPAVGEELFFRNFLQKYLVRITKNIHVGVILTAFVFSFLHFQFLGFVPRFILGLIFGYLFVWSGSIWISMVAHFVNNGLVVVVMYFISKGDIGKEIETVGAKPELLPVAVLSLMVGSSLLYVVYKHIKAKAALAGE